MEHKQTHTVYRNIVVGFALIIILFILAGFVAFLEINALGNLTSTIYKHPLEVSNAALRANMGVVRMHRAIKGIVLADDDINLEKFIVQVDNEEAIVFQNLDIIRNKILGVEGQDLEKETRALFANWKTIRDDPELKRLSLQFIEDSYKAIITVGKHLERLTGATLIVELATPQFDQLNSWGKPPITSKDKENLCEFQRKIGMWKRKTV